MIRVAPLHELEAELARWRPSHVVSLGSPGAEAAALPGDLKTLRLTFNDIAEPRDDLVMATQADIEALLAFAGTWDGERPLLVHCWAGVSRSPAAAYVLACAMSSPGQEAELAAGLRQAAPFATPNRHVVALADRLLERQGAMSSAIAALGRGAETSMGSSFGLPLHHAATEKARLLSGCHPGAMQGN